MLITAFFSYCVWSTAEAKDLERFNATTADVKEEDKRHSLAAGYQRYPAKPVELGDFIAVTELARMEFTRS